MRPEDFGIKALADLQTIFDEKKKLKELLHAEEITEQEYEDRISVFVSQEKNLIKALEMSQTNIMKNQDID